MLPPPDAPRAESHIRTWCDASDMRDLGVKKIGQRKALIAARDKLFEDECSDEPLPSGTTPDARK